MFVVELKFDTIPSSVKVIPVTPLLLPKLKALFEVDLSISVVAVLVGFVKIFTKPLHTVNIFNPPELTLVILFNISAVPSNGALLLYAPLVIAEIVAEGLFKLVGKPQIPVKVIFVAVAVIDAKPARPNAKRFVVAPPIASVPALPVSILFVFTAPARFIVVPVIFAVVAPAPPNDRVVEFVVPMLNSPAVALSKDVVVILFTDALRADKLRMDTLFMETLLAVILFTDALRADKLRTDTLLMDALLAVILFTDVLSADKLRMDTLFMETLFAVIADTDIFNADKLRMDTLNADKFIADKFTEDKFTFEILVTLAYEPVIFVKLTLVTDKF